MSCYVFVARKWRPDGGGGGIDLAEWRSFVEGDPQLVWAPSIGENAVTWRVGEREPEWIDWQAGRLEANRPSSALIEKLLPVAETFQAQLSGEGGEVYGPGGVVSQPTHVPSVADRLLAFWLRLKAIFVRPTAPDPGFGVGTRVRGLRGRLGTVETIDLRAERGLGCIKVRYDDGGVESSAALAHCLEAVDQVDRV